VKSVNFPLLERGVRGDFIPSPLGEKEG